MWFGFLFLFSENGSHLFQMGNWEPTQWEICAALKAKATPLPFIEDLPKKIQNKLIMADVGRVPDVSCHCSHYHLLVIVI
jgi:hypothetical protein